MRIEPDASIMKKLLAHILAGVTCLTLAACAVQPETHADLPATVNATSSQ